MKNNFGQLEDTVILSLADAHDDGMDFSDACFSAHVPEGLESEAREFWFTLSSQATFADSLCPRKDIIDQIFLNADIFKTGEILRPASPSPYMKYVMAFAAPLALAVLVIGVAFRTTDKTISPLAAVQELSVNANPVAFSVEGDAPLSAHPQPAARNTAAPALLLAKTVSAPSSAASIATKTVSKKDPKQLFAMLQDAGVQEAQPDTQVDDAYDARLSALDAKVIDQNSNINAYVPLQ